MSVHTHLKPRGREREGYGGRAGEIETDGEREGYGGRAGEIDRWRKRGIWG
jgi:hypothetical protein